MTYQKMLGQYKRLNVETASRLDLVLMCYEKAIELLRQAKSCFEERRYEDKARRLQKALDILCELQGCLDFEKGGQIARNLGALYSYLTRRLLEGDLRRDMTAFEEAIRLLSELKDAWQRIASDQTLQSEPESPDPQMRASLGKLAA